MNKKTTKRLKNNSRFFDLSDDLPVEDNEPELITKPPLDATSKAITQTNILEEQVKKTEIDIPISNNSNVLSKAKEEILEKKLAVSEVIPEKHNEKTQQTSNTQHNQENETPQKSLNYVDKSVISTSPITKNVLNQNSVNDEKQKLAIKSFEIPQEELLDKGYHFYCSVRVLDKVRRYAKQKNITISKLITMILDKVITEE